MAAQLGINRSSPLIYCLERVRRMLAAGNQSFIPFDILQPPRGPIIDSWESIVHPL